MSFSLNKIQKGPKKEPRKILIYGPPKLGKSTLAGATKNALLIPTEDRVSHIECDKTPVIKSYGELFKIFTVLLEEKHSYKRVIIDTLDWLEPLLHQQVIDDLNEGKSEKIKSITDDHSKETAFFKGLKYHAVAEWKKFFNYCDVMRENGFDVVLVAHSAVINVNMPDVDPYDKYVMKVDKHALSVIEEWADIIAFYDKEIIVRKEGSAINKKGKAISKHSRKLYLDGENPAMISGNSYGLDNAGNIQIEDCAEIMEWLLTANNNTTKIKQEKK